MPKRCLVLLLFSLPFGLSSLPAKLPVRPIAQGACAAAILGLVAKEHLRVLAARKELAVVLARGNEPMRSHLQSLRAENLERVAVDLLFGSSRLHRINEYKTRAYTLFDARKEKEALLTQRVQEPAGSPLYQELTFKIALAAAMTHLEDMETARAMKNLLLLGYFGAVGLSVGTSRISRLPAWTLKTMPFFPLLKNVYDGGLRKRGSAFWHFQIGYALGLAISNVPLPK